MEKKTTDELEKIVNEMKPDDIDKYFKDNNKYLAEGDKAFSYYFKDTALEKNITLKNIFIAADVSQKYGEKIVSMEKHTKNRDLILRLCIAGHFLIDEINRALKLYGMKPLYVKDKRDVCIMVAVKNRIYEIADIDDLLVKEGFEKLSVNE